MAKYDYYSVKVSGRNNPTIEVDLRLLFEDGDDITAVIETANNEAVAAWEDAKDSDDDDDDDD